MRRLFLLITAIALAITMFVNWIYIVRVPIITSKPASKSYCHCITKTTQTMTMPKTPPWSSNATIRSEKTLYVWTKETRQQRLGNRLFNYAATFGIAWRNWHHPLLPDTTNTSKQYDLSKYFNIRIPIDRDNKITEVNRDTCLLVRVQLLQR